MTSRPNILLALADDASHFGCDGNKFVDTPHLDGVAAEGIRFRNMFTTNPKCAPSRASLLTGYHTWQLEEACTHWCEFPGPDRFAVYPDLLEAAGYHVGFTGKGWAPGDWETQGRRRNPAGTEYNTRRLEPPDGSQISACDYAANFEDFLNARNAATPFCFWYGGHEPHRHYTPGEGIAHGKRPDDIEHLPPYWPDDALVRSDLCDYAFEIDWFDQQLGVMLKLLEERGELDNTLVIVSSDNGCPFPRVKGQMYEDDFKLPCVAMWKKGMPGGRVVDDLCSFVDIAPTLMELAGLEVPARWPGTSLVDIIKATCHTQVTTERDQVYMGRERHDLGREGDRGYPVRCLRTRSHLYIRNYAPERWPAGNPETGFTNCDSSPTKTRILALVDDAEQRYFSLCFGKRPAEELYDIRADPHCMRDLARVPEHRGLCTRMREQLEDYLRSTDDPRLHGKGEIFDSYRYVGAEDASHSWAHYVDGTWSPQQY